MKIDDEEPGCHGPLLEECEKCKIFKDCSERKLKYYSRIPHVILDVYLKGLSRSAFKVFLYLNKKADFREHSNNFGKCWATYGQINDATGVSINHMGKYLKELEEFGLITWKQTKTSKGGEVKTINHFTVTWYTRFKRLGAQIWRTWLIYQAESLDWWQRNLGNLYFFHRILILIFRQGSLFLKQAKFISSVLFSCALVWQSTTF